MTTAAEPSSPASGLDGFLTPSEIARLNHRTTRTIMNWRQAGIFPPPDAILNGQPVWRRSTYERWQQEVLDGKFAGRDRAAHLRASVEARHDDP